MFFFFFFFFLHAEVRTPGSVVTDFDQWSLSVCVLVCSFPFLAVFLYQGPPPPPVDSGEYCVPVLLLRRSKQTSCGLVVESSLPIVPAASYALSDPL